MKIWFADRHSPQMAQVRQISTDVCYSVAAVGFGDFEADRRMRDWQAKLQSVVGKADELSDSLRSRVKRLTGTGSPLSIVPYLGYGTAETLLLKGRVLADEGIKPSTDADTTWNNLVRMYRRFESDEVPGARLLARFQGSEQAVVTDNEGYFDLQIKPTQALTADLWQEVEIELLDPPPRAEQMVRATGKVIVPPAAARFGVISDIDDTVVWTNVTNKLKMILIVALLNERTRMPFKGVASFYRALQQGATGNEGNPIFYVSSSPWNLYVPLLEFFTIHDIPTGPLFLKDFGDHLLFSSKDHRGHKMMQIDSILARYPHLPFILIGDSGEQDPEIYREIVRKYPNRIRVIYIRNVNPNPARIQAIDTLIEEVRQTGSQLVLTPDSEFAAAHAAAEGLIATVSLPDVRMEKQADETAPDAKEVVEAVVANQSEPNS